MKHDRDLIIRFIIYDLEGGDKIVNDPAGPGGLTKFGISQRANPDVDIRNLSLADAIIIYENKYWFPTYCDRYDFPINLIIFDTAVNCGAKLAAELRYAHEVKGKNWEGLIFERIRYYSRLCRGKSKYDKFFEGWMNRLLKIITEIEEVMDLCGKQ